MDIKKIVLIVGFIFYSTQAISHQKMKLYAIYTPSHEILKDKFFLPSIQDDFEIILEQCDQTSPSAKFMSEGWTDTTIRKVELIIQAVKENWNSVFIFSDVDIQFFRPIEKTILSLMKNNDLVIQKNSPNGVLCSGFFACRGNEKTLQLWTDVKAYMENDKSKSDQVSLNHCIKRSSTQNPYGLKWGYLPNSFFGGGTLTGCTWCPGKKLPVPSNIMMHHANWTKGISNKIAQLKYVKSVVKKLKTPTP